MIKTFKDLVVWQKSYVLTLDVYKETKEFPTDEKYGLTSQIRRAAASIPFNIAEGYGRRYLGQYIQFLKIAYASGAELETQLLLAKDLEYLNQAKFNDLFEKQNEIERMLAALIRALGERHLGIKASRCREGE